jgi:hypothetical protein
MGHASHYFKLVLKDTFNCAWNLKKDGKYYTRLCREKCGVEYLEEAFTMVVDFAYTGKPIVSMQETMHMVGWSDDEDAPPSMLLECDILKLADFLSMDWMVSVYTSLFHLRLTPTTVLGKLCIVSKIPGLKDATSAAIDYLVENIDAVKVQCM